MDIWRHKQAQKQAQQQAAAQLYGSNLGCISHCYGLGDDQAPTPQPPAAPPLWTANGDRNTMIVGSVGALAGALVAARGNGLVGAMAGFSFAYLLAKYFYGGWVR